MSLSVICHNVANMYAEPDDRSERVSQLILNDSVQALEEKAEFVLIEGRDDYQGWIRNELVLLDNARMDMEIVIDAGVMSVWQTPEYAALVTQLVFGTRLAKRDIGMNGLYQILLPKKQGMAMGYCENVHYEDSGYYQPENWTGDEMVEMAGVTCIGTPYLWGGTTTFGFDCSGLTQRLYGLWDIVLPRDAYLQYESPLGDKLSEGEPYQSGDLVFWVGKSDPRNRGITHVGIMMDETQVIHAYSKMGVIVTPFAEMTSKLGYTYRGAWRYRSEAAE